MVYIRNGDYGMNIVINEDFSAVITDSVDNPTQMLKLPSYNVETMDQFISASQAQEQAERYAVLTKLMQPYVSPEEEAALESEQAKSRAIAEINATFEEEIAAIKTGYVEDEIQSWPQQIAEAQAYQADQTASTPLLDAMVAERGTTKDELVIRIATNASAYAAVLGAALGKKQKAIADLG